MEIWKEIKGYEDYQVSNLGRVKSLKYDKERILKPSIDRGYHRYTLSKENIMWRTVAHRLVAEAFIMDGKTKPCVNHIDGNPSNNCVENLEWCTYSENERHSYDILNKINANRKLSKEAVKDILENCVKGKSKSKRGNVFLFVGKYGVDKTTILNVLNKRYYV